MTSSTAQATLGGGCFWCTEAVFQQIRGVRSVASGYAGGHVDAPSYEAVCEGDTGHAEVVRVTFDSGELSYRDVLEIFFASHDPTTRDRQGNDVGPQYRSVIFWHDDAQRATAEALIAEYDRDLTFGGPIVTELAPLTTFWPAERYHHDYFRRNPLQPYCAFVVSPKVAKIRKTFAPRLAHP